MTTLKETNQTLLQKNQTLYPGCRQNHQYPTLLNLFNEHSEFMENPQIDPSKSRQGNPPHEGPRGEDNWQTPPRKEPIQQHQNRANQPTITIDDSPALTHHNIES